MTKSQFNKMINDLSDIQLQITYLNMLMIKFLTSKSENLNLENKFIYEIDLVKERIEKIKNEISEDLLTV